MNRIAKKTLCVVLTLLMTLSCLSGLTAFAAPGDNIVYKDGWTVEIIANKGTITGYTGEEKEKVELPDTVKKDSNDIPITAVKGNVCKDKTAITNLTVPKSITQFEGNAFSGCTGLLYADISSEITVTGNAFNGVNSKFYFLVSIKEAYATEDAAKAALSAKVPGTWTSTSVGDPEDNKFIFERSNDINGHPVRSSVITLVKDTVAPTATIKLASSKSTLGNWSDSVSVDFAAPKLNFDNGGFSFFVTGADSGEAASGVKSVEYYIAEQNPGTLPDSAWKAITDEDGKITDTLLEHVPYVIYARVTDNADNVKVINTECFFIDNTAATGKISYAINDKNGTAATRDFEKAHFLTETTIGSVTQLIATFEDKADAPVVFTVTAEDTKVGDKEGSGIGSVGYYVANEAVANSAALDALANSSWTALTSSNWKTTGAQFTVSGSTGDEQNCIVYVKITDKAGRPTYISSNGFKASDGLKPVITADTYVRDEVAKKTEAKTLTLDPAKATTVNYPALVKATDNSSVKSLTYKLKTATKDSTIAKPSEGELLSKEGTYTITATDDAGNTVTCELIIDIKDDKVPVVKGTSKVDGKDQTVTFEASKSYTYNYPVTITASDDDLLIGMYYIHTDADKKKTTKSIDPATEPFALTDAGTYDLCATDAVGNEFKCTVVMNVPEGTVSSVKVDTGNKIDPSVLPAAGGGDFTITVEGTQLNSRLAIFNGTTLVGVITPVGSDKESVSKAVIAKKTYDLPANKTDKAVIYTVRLYDAGTADKDVVSTKGTEWATVVVSPATDTLTVDPATLTLNAKGEAKEITVTSNTRFVATASAAWLTVAPQGGDNTLKLLVSATENTGADRTATITFTTAGATPATFTVNVTQEHGKTSVKRISGDDRYATAIEISKAGWSKSDIVLLANGQNYADALAAAPLAGAVNAPILTTFNYSSGLEKNVLTEITRLGAKKVYILGGEAVVNANIEKVLKQYNIEVVRLAGDTRYGTAVAIAKELNKVSGRSFSRIYFASGVNYPDALSIGSVAAIEGNPVLYLPADGAMDSITAAYAKSLKEAGFTSAVILGGPAAISAKSENSVKSLGFTAERVYGADRYETSAAIIRKYGSVFTGSDIAVATGTDFADALVGGAYAGMLKMPIVLVADRYYTSAAGIIKSLNPATIFVLGGEAAVPTTLVDRIK